MGFFAPGMAAGITQGLDQYANRQNVEQLMAARAQRMREEAMQQQMLVDQHNQQVEANRNGGAALEKEYGFLMNGPMPPQPGQASVPMQRPTSPMQAPPQPGQPGMPNIDVNAPSAQNFANLRQWAEANPPSGQTSADYPNWKPGMAPRSLQEGVVPFNQPMNPVASAPIGQGYQGVFRTAMPDYEGVPPPAGRVELGNVNAEPPRPVIPPYKTINRNPEQPPQAQEGQAIAPPTSPKQDAMPKRGFSWEQAVRRLLQNGVKSEMLLPSLMALKPALDMEARDKLAEVTAQYKQGVIEDKVVQRGIDQQKADTREDEVGHLNQTRQQNADNGTARAQAMMRKAQQDAAEGRPPSRQTVDFYAEQSLAGDNSWQVGLARGKVGQQLIAAVKDRIPQMARETNQTPQDVSANKSSHMALTKTLADRQKYSTAVDQLQGTLSKQADLVESLLAKGASESGSPVLNKWLQAGRTATGDPDVRAFNAAIVGLSREHQRVLTSPLSNAQLHASSQDTADKLINTADTPESIRTLIKVMKTEAANGRKQARETLAELQGQLKGMGRGSKSTESLREWAASPADEALIKKYLK